jgi:hypothetical protein
VCWTAQLRERVHKLGQLLARPEIVRNIRAITVTRSKWAGRCVCLSPLISPPRARSEFLPPPQWPNVRPGELWPAIEARVLAMLRGVMASRGLRLRVLYDTSERPRAARVCDCVLTRRARQRRESSPRAPRTAPTSCHSATATRPPRAFCDARGAV